MGAALLAAGLVAYNNLVNLWRGFSGVVYVPLNLAVAVVVLAAARWGLDVDAASLGLAWEGVWVGLAAGALLASPAVLLASFSRTAHRVADRRLEGVTAAGGLFVVLIRIPLGTAFLEEAVFRGALYGAWRGSGALTAALASSVAFGLWHITPTYHLVRANRPGATAATRAAVVAGGVVFTFAAGLGFAWLRERYGSIAAPWGLHAAVNSIAAAASLAALRRTRNGTASGPGGTRGDATG